MQRFIWIAAFVIGVGVGSMWWSGTQPGAAQEQPIGMQSLFTELVETETLATVEFANQAGLLDRVMVINDGRTEITRIGRDMVCFTQGGESSRQIVCVPYSNIIGVTYAE